METSLSKTPGEEAPPEMALRSPLTRRLGLRRGMHLERRARPITPDPVLHLRIIEVRGPLGGICKVFRAVAEDDRGRRFDIAVKPKPREGLLPGHLFANWCGDLLAEILGVPTPGLYLVDVEREMLRSLGPAYAEIEPGLALASIFQPGAVPCALMYPLPDKQHVRNGDHSVAAATVLDTILQYTDRGGDVLVVPARDGSGKYDLCFNDNGWLVWFPAPVHTHPLVVRAMTHPWLRSMVAAPTVYDPPIFMAETLHHRALQSAFAACPARFRDDPIGPTPRQVVRTARERAAELRGASAALPVGP
jgi:hypothetical protein